MTDTKNPRRHPDWPEGYFERTVGSLTDDPMERITQCMVCDDGAKLQRFQEWLAANIESDKKEATPLPPHSGLLVTEWHEIFSDDLKIAIAAKEYILLTFCKMVMGQQDD